MVNVAAAICTTQCITVTVILMCRRVKDPPTCSINPCETLNDQAGM
ncbi:unnamed protein product, partial [Vitis vinifera]|uniref:Uncharacterized protein n=1 Tax=Vitis vinifera TaxID=29760 RepID=E0CSY0_VITVI